MLESVTLSDFGRLSGLDHSLVIFVEVGDRTIRTSSALSDLMTKRRTEVVWLPSSEFRVLLAFFSDLSPAASCFLSLYLYVGRRLNAHFFAPLAPSLDTNLSAESGSCFSNAKKSMIFHFPARCQAFSVSA